MTSPWIRTCKIHSFLAEEFRGDPNKIVLQASDTFFLLHARKKQVVNFPLDNSVLSLNEETTYGLVKDSVREFTAELNVRLGEMELIQQAKTLLEDSLSLVSLLE
jgi:hypothetical protein